MSRKFLTLVSSIIIILIVVVSCKSTSTTIAYTVSEQKYKILAQYPDFFWCDPEYWPVVREGVEQQNAIDRFSVIQANQEEFNAILAHLNLPEKSNYTNEEKLLIYREHKDLNGALKMTSSDSGFIFTIRTGENHGQSIEGTISQTGIIKETKRISSINTCPICLTGSTLIDTPDGPLPVGELKAGMQVYTVNGCGGKESATITEVVSVTVPTDFETVKITLNDGRSVTASPGHPTADGRTLGSLKSGDILDAALVISVESVPYSGETYDILPEGTTGEYWANGILLKSTLK